MHALSLHGYYKSEAIEPYTIVNIVKLFGRFIYRPMRQGFLYKVTDI